MNIVFIITDYGSFNNFLGEVAVSLLRNGNKVHLISSSNKVINIDDKFDYVGEGLQVNYVDFPRGFNPFKHSKASSIIQNIVNNINPDFVSVHFTTGVFTTTFNRRLKFKTIGTFHGLGFPVVDGFFKKLIYRFVEKRSMNRVDEVWLLNRMDLNIVNSELPSVKAYQIPTKGLGCDLNKFNPDNFDIVFKNNLRNSLNISEDDFVIGFTGRFVTFKGYNKVVKAFKSLKERGVKDIKLILIGGIDIAHSTGLDELEESWIEGDDSVLNIGFSSKVEEYLSITDLFVFPSEKEGMPVCIIESLAMNVPVLTADARGCNDLIINNHNGILLQNNTVEEIAREILRIKQDYTLYNQMKFNITKERFLMDRRLFVEQQLNFFNNKSNN